MKINKTEHIGQFQDLESGHLFKSIEFEISGPNIKILRMVDWETRKTTTYVKIIDGIEEVYYFNRKGYPERRWKRNINNYFNFSDDTWNRNELIGCHERKNQRGETLINES